MNFYGSEDTIKLFEQYAEKYKNEPSIQSIFNEISWHYLMQNRTKDAEQFFDIILKVSPKRLFWEYNEIAYQYGRLNMKEKAEKYYSKAADLRKRYYFNPITRSNYQKLYEVLNKRGIKLIAVQYPTLSLDELKILFKGDEDITFVDNEVNFEKALKTARYEELFRDRSWTTFGHLTSKGANMVADNVANTVLKDLEIIQTK